MATKVNAELLKQLDDAGDSRVQAVVELRPPDRPKATPTPDEVTKLADDVLARVTKEVGHPAVRHNVLRNVASLVVDAAPDFVRSLVRQPEVISALPNRTSECMVIPPKGKRKA